MQYKIALAQSGTGVWVGASGLLECWSQGAREARWASGALP